MKWRANTYVSDSWVSDCDCYQIWKQMGNRGYFEVRRRRAHPDGPGEVGQVPSLELAMDAAEKDAARES